MKVLIAGSNKPWAIERYFIAYLTKLGAEVHLYAAPDIVFDNHSKNILNKILFKTGINTGYKGVNAGLLSIADSVKPDYIMIFKGMEIYPSTLELLRRRFKLVNYNPDHPFIIGSSGGGNKNVSKGVGLYHLHFCYNRELQKKIEEDFQIPTVFLPFGYDLAERDYLKATQEVEIKKVCFIGNPDNTRVDAIKLAAENGFFVDVYGHGWNKTTLHGFRGVGINDAIYGLEFWRKLRQYRVQLNIFRKHNLGSHNMRSFEISAVGGIQLAPFSREQADFFEEGREIFFYRSPKEMLEQIETLLGYPDEQAERVRQAARERSLESGYSYENRALTVYKTFESMLDNG